MYKIPLVLATNNSHKVKEIRKILPQSFDLISLKEAGVLEELPETAGTIPGNAVQKARRVWELTGLECIADDSGLEVVALEGAPGVDSALYAGLPKDDKRNMARLLQEMNGVQNREAAFVTVIALVLKGEVYTFEGRINGAIALTGRGKEGFGYDPVFIPEGAVQTFAEMPEATKNSISHRALALKKLQAFFEKHGQQTG